MRRDLIIGILCSLLLHAGLGLGGEINFNFFAKKKVVKKDEAPVIQLEMPKLEPEPPEPTESDTASSEVASLVPPSVADVPGVVDLNSFVQPVQPPPPPTAGITMTIPKSTGPAATGAMTKVFDLKDLDQAPVPRFKANPAYPFEMKRQGISAEVLVEFICDGNGDVRDARVLGPTRLINGSFALVKRVAAPSMPVCNSLSYSALLTNNLARHAQLFQIHIASRQCSDCIRSAGRLFGFC